MEKKYDMDTLRIPEIYPTATHIGLGKVRLDFKSHGTNTAIFSPTDSDEGQRYYSSVMPLQKLQIGISLTPERRPYAIPIPGR